MSFYIPRRATATCGSGFACAPLLSLLLNQLTAGYTETQVVDAIRWVVAAAACRSAGARAAPPVAATIYAVRAQLGANWIDTV